MSVRRFSFIGEAEARAIEPGATIEIDRGGHITPLALDTLRARRVTIVAAGDAAALLPPDLAPATSPSRLVVAADRDGARIAPALVLYLRGAGKVASDPAPAGASAPSELDVIEASAAAGRLVARHEADAAVVVTGVPLIAVVAANKVRGIRAAYVTSTTAAREARETAGTNLLVLGAVGLTTSDAIEIVKAWLSTGTTSGDALQRLLKIRRLDAQF